MQTFSTAFQAELVKGQTDPTVLVDLYEFYDPAYTPSPDGFDPADAIETFAGQEITWKGVTYRREVISRGDIVLNVGEKTNSVSIEFSNITRYLATFAQTQQIEGMLLCIRCVSPIVEDDSKAMFHGRCDKPGDIDKGRFPLTARQDFGNLNQEAPPREFTAEDPEGRTPDDPLFEGINFYQIQGSFTTPNVVLKGGIAGLLGRHKTVSKTEQWSSLDSTPYGSAIPEVFGRTQLSFIVIASADKGVTVTALMAVCAGPIKAIENIHTRTDGISDPINLPGPTGPVVHLGDPGGTGTNMGSVQADLGGGQFFSHLAYVEGGFVPKEIFTNPSFSDPDVLNEPPVVTGIVLGRIVPVPDSDGEYTLEDWTDNPVHIARFILTHPSFVNIDPAFMEDAVNYLTSLHCDEPIMDDTTSQLIVVPNVEIDQAGDSFSRFRSTGLITPRSILYEQLGDDSIIPATTDGPYLPYNPAGPIDDPPLRCLVGYHHDPGTGECVPDVTGSTSLPGDVQLTSGVTLGGQIVAEGAWKFYYITVPTGATQLQVVVTGSGDGETYTRALAKPDRSTYDAFAYNPSPEICTNPNPVQGTWWVGVFGRVGGASFSLTATVTGGSGGTGYSPINGKQGLLIKRYRANFPITEKIRVVDLLYKILFPAFKGFLRVNKRGKFEILSEQPSDSTRLRSATAVGATSISVLDVTPWKSGNLLIGRLLTGLGLTTSEVRNVLSADYSTSGNSIALSATASGSMTATASGATLSGGSTSVQASGTVTIGGTPETGKIVTIAIDGISVAYVLSPDDTTGTVAGMLAAYINATPRLRKYLVAEWNPASPTVITIKCLHGALNLDSALLKAHTGPIVDPGTAPTIAGSGSGALAAGTYQVAYADETANGLSALTPTATVLLTASQKIDVSSLPALVGTGRQFFVSDSPNSTNLRWAVTRVNNSNFSINALPLPGAAMPPSFNTTAEELIRVAMSFATNSQDVFPSWRPSIAVVLNDIYLPDPLNGHKYQATSITTGITAASAPAWPTTAGGTVVDGGVTWTEIGSTVLKQAGLTRANVIKKSFKWPLGSQQSSVNQIKISYRSSAQDFALIPYRVNDPEHQAKVKKIYPLEVDGSAIDSFHQMFRIANWQLSKNREGDWFNSLETGPQGLVLEEGDVICSSDDSGGLVNVATRVEELRIKANHEVSITLARKYSTLMYSDDVGSHRIAIPSVLRFVQTVDSIIEFIDSPPIRDADGLTPGFYVAVGRDLSIDGDWRGWSLWADYGDGYVKIAEGDVPATIGECTMTLGAVSDPSVWDYANSVTFTLKYAREPLSFSNATRDDLLANDHRNLFLIGDEFVQATEITDNGNRSFTIGGSMLRGRFGTEQNMAHGASERVVYMNGAEQFVKIDAFRINREFNYKVVTLNQNVSEAIAIPFEWAGQNLKPLAVSNPRGSRDSANSLLVEMEFRSRMSGGLRSYQAGAVNEEIEEGQIQILDSGSPILPSGNQRTIPVIVGMPLAAFLESDGATSFTYVTGNTLDTPNPFAGSINARAFQTIEATGNYVEAKLEVGIEDVLLEAGAIAGFGLFPSTFAWRKATYAQMLAAAHLWVQHSTNDSFQTHIRLYEYGVSKYLSSLTLGTTSRFRFGFSGKETRVYRDWTGSAGELIYSSPKPQTFPYAVILRCEFVSRVRNMILTTSPFPKTIYSATQQTEDGFTPGGPIEMDIWQESKIVGPGIKTRVTL